MNKDSIRIENSLDIKCEVIQDLMPSYLDEICSDASRELVDQHMQNCESCRKRCELLKNWSNDFAVETMEKKQLDSMQKVRRKMQTQKWFLTAVCAWLVWLGYSTFIDFRSPLFPGAALQIIMQILLLLAAEAGYRRNEKQDESTIKAAGKKDIEVILAAVLLMVAAFTGMHVAWGRLEAGASDFFGIKWDQVGPLMSLFFGLVFAVNFAGIFYYYPKVMAPQTHRRWMLAVFLTGALLMVSYCGMLHNMAYPEASIHCLNTDTTVIGGIGVIGIALNLLYDRLRE